MKHLLDIKPNGGTYIYSACEAFNEEMEVDFQRLWCLIGYFNITSCGFSFEKNDWGEYGLCFDPQYHASGHASIADIRNAIEGVDPDHIVPIHAEARDWFTSNFENVVIVNEGEPKEF